jgi:hypothetical protein
LVVWLYRATRCSASPRVCEDAMTFVKQSERAQIEIASQREAKTVILQSNRRLVQKRDLASDTQSLFRVGDHLGRQSHPPKKRRDWYPGALEARDSQAGKAPLRRRD